MIIPSIDLSDGQAVQLIGGEHLAIEAGDPFAIAERFALAGEIAVIDLDAARRCGSNRDIVLGLVAKYPCRVGGGIRDVESAKELLDAGAAKVILGTAAEPGLLSKLPRQRVIAALDARHGEVVVDGWRAGTGRTIREQMQRLSEVVGGFLVTVVEREGRMVGVDRDLAQQLVEWSGEDKVTLAGGVSSLDDITEMDRCGVDVQVGMALYTGKIDLADAILAPMRSDRPDGLWATVIVDELGHALGLAWSDPESARRAIHGRCGAYHSRSRGLWVKGESSGNTQRLLRVDLDCDRDALRFVVRQQGSGFCHQGTRTCWGDDGGLAALMQVLERRTRTAPEGSYTRRLLDDPTLLEAKLVEEAIELSRATPEQVAQEAADLLYFTLTAMARANVELAEVERVLDRRQLRVTRRPGHAKPEVLDILKPTR